MADTNEDGGAPWWVKSVVAFGAPTVGLAYIIYWLLNTQVSATAEIAARQAQIESALSAQRADTSYLVMQLDRQDVLLRQICWNSGRTTTDRNACYGNGR